MKNELSRAFYVYEELNSNSVCYVSTKHTQHVPVKQIKKI